LLPVRSRRDPAQFPLFKIGPSTQNCLRLQDLKPKIGGVFKASLQSNWTRRDKTKTPLCNERIKPTAAAP
jgi:hypothetical protein